MSKVLTFLVILLFKQLCLFAQVDTVRVYTKDGCSNCRYAKNELNQAAISYQIKKLENANNGKELLQTLEAVGYKGKIHLPVIFINRQLIHPVFQSDTSLKPITLVSALDSIMCWKEKGELQLLANVSDDALLNESLEAKNNDCEYDLPLVYLIHKNFKTENEAVKFLEGNNRNRFENAGYLEYNKLFRVYVDVYSDHEKAERELVSYRKENKSAYLLFPK